MALTITEQAGTIGLNIGIRSDSMTQSINQLRQENVGVLQQTMKVAFQGELGAFGNEAVQAYFDGEIHPEPVPCRSFADVFRAVATGEVEHGLVPVENSQAGSINDVYDLLRQHDLYVIGEISHP